MKIVKILFEGDSITDGNRYKSRASEWDKNHQIGHSYAYIITGLLGLMYPQRHLEFVNRAVSGSQTGALLSRWEEDVLAVNPDVLSVLVGVNDCIYHDRDGKCDYSAGDFERNYRKLLTLSKEKNPALTLILLEPFAHIPDQKNAPTTDIARAATLRSEQKIVRRLAEEFDAVFVPLQAAFDEAMTLREPKYWIWDGTHPTEAGHALIAREFLKHTKDIFGYEL